MHRIGPSREVAGHSQQPERILLPALSRKSLHGRLLSIAVIAGSASCALGVPIFSPTGYDQTTRTGFKASPAIPSSFESFYDSGIGNAVAVANVLWYEPNRGGQPRAFRWGSNGGSALGTLGGTTRVWSINASNVSVGFSTPVIGNVFHGARAVRWDAEATIPTVLGSLNAGANATPDGAHDISDSGIIVGYSTLVDDRARGLRAVRWEAGSTVPTELGHLGTASDGVTTAKAYKVNERGDAIGWAYKFDATGRLGPRAVRWDANTTAATELDNLGTDDRGETETRAYSLNDAGTVVGTALTYVDGVDVGPRAVRWDAGTSTVTELGHLGVNPTNGVTVSTATSINNAGVAVGFARGYVHGSSSTRAVRWMPDSIEPIELPGYGARSEAWTINESGTVGGFADLAASNVHRAALWDAQGQMTDLNSLLPPDSGWTLLRYVSAITDSGWVTGDGQFDPDGEGPLDWYERNFLMLVPQAGTYGRGDANFDTRIDFDDLLILAQHYGESNPSQDVHVGDFDLNGVVDFDDLLALAQHYEDAPAFLDTGARDSSFAADWALARSIVPEPTLIGLMGLSVRRRRR